MRFTVSVVTAMMAMASSAFAQTADFDPITKPAAKESVPAGETYEITWTAPAKYADGTVAISLIGGESQNKQVPLVDIASGVKNSDEKYSWNVDSSLGAEKVYGLVFKLESDPDVFQYSNPFSIKKSGDSGKDGDTTVHITKSSGVKTVHLSTTPVTTTSTSSTRTPTPTSTPHSTHNTTSSSTTMAKPTTQLITSTAIAEPPTTTSAAAVPTGTDTGAAHRVAAGPLALVAALAVAALAL